MLKQITSSLNQLRDKYFVFIFFIVLPVFSYGFPEMSRHGYLSCNTCHYSPGGAGLLTYYGKSIAQELYSLNYNKKKEASMEEEPPWWRVGGQFRVMQLLTDSSTVQRARLFPMQSEVEVAVDKKKWAFIFGIGAWRSIEAENKSLKSYIKNLYTLYRQGEFIQYRLGKFRTRFGLGLPDHTLLTTQGMGWTPSHETKNIEVNYIGEERTVAASYVLPSNLIMTEEELSGIVFNFDQLIKSKHKIGLSLAQFTREGIIENQQNINTVLALNSTSFLQFELGYRSIASPNKLNQYALMSKYSREVKFNLKPYVQLENGLLNIESHEWAQRFFIGTEWYPFDYFDGTLFAGLEKQRATEENRIISFIGHFYF